MGLPTIIAENQTTDSLCLAASSFVLDRFDRRASLRVHLSYALMPVHKDTK